MGTAIPLAFEARKKQAGAQGKQWLERTWAGMIRLPPGCSSSQRVTSSTMPAHTPVSPDPAVHSCSHKEHADQVHSSKKL